MQQTRVLFICAIPEHIRGTRESMSSDDQDTDCQVPEPTFHRQVSRNTGASGHLSARQSGSGLTCTGCTVQ